LTKKRIWYTWYRWDWRSKYCCWLWCSLHLLWSGLRLLILLWKLNN